MNAFLYSTKKGETYTNPEVTNRKLLKTLFLKLYPQFIAENEFLLIALDAFMQVLLIF